MSDIDPSVTVHSSWKGVILSIAGASVVFAFGLGITLASGGATIPVAVLVLGTIFLATVLFDYPVSSRFTADAVERRALLRHHRIAWDRVDQLTRARPVVAGLRNLTPGGLAAKVGRRRYLLVDQCEALSEFDDLAELLADRYEELGVDEMIQPGTTTDPTWAYRRRRWQPKP